MLGRMTLTWTCTVWPPPSCRWPPPSAASWGPGSYSSCTPWYRTTQSGRTLSSGRPPSSLMSRRGSKISTWPFRQDVLHTILNHNLPFLLYLLLKKCLKVRLKNVVFSIRFQFLLRNFNFSRQFKFTNKHVQLSRFRFTLQLVKMLVAAPAPLQLQLSVLQFVSFHLKFWKSFHFKLWKKMYYNFFHVTGTYWYRTGIYLD